MLSNSFMAFFTVAPKPAHSTLGIEPPSPVFFNNHFLGKVAAKWNKQTEKKINSQKDVLNDRAPLSGACID